MTKKELKARVRELEVDNARLRGENAALRTRTIPGPVQVGDVPPWRPGMPQVWCGTTTAGANFKHFDDYPRLVTINDGERAAS